uniref:Uncharacterized protein n=1 Tax=Arundo donax TaxID=35708 RepID=A0A0A9C1S8_ARUDO
MREEPCRRHCTVLPRDRRQKGGDPTVFHAVALLIVPVAILIIIHHEDDAIPRHLVLRNAN